MSDPIEVPAGTLTLSGILAAPATTARGLLVALHGGGYTGKYWDGAAQPEASLLRLGAERGLVTVALDRPGYGRTVGQGCRLAQQAEIVFDAIAELRRHHGPALPVFVAGHSMGGILTLMMAAHPRASMLAAVDVCGVPLRFTEETRRAIAAPTASGHVHRLPISLEQRRARYYGRDGTFLESSLLDDDLASAPVPGIEVADAASAPEALPPLMRRTTLPVRYTQSEFDTSLSDPETLAFARDCLSASRGAQVRFEPDCGHNISLHQVAGAFHAGMLDFFEPLAR